MKTLSLAIFMTTIVTPALATPVPVTKFSCVRSGENFATIARRGNRSTPPMILWETRLGLWDAWERCRVVSQRLTDAVAESGGNFRDLFLTYGRVNSQPVVCHVNSMERGCNAQNLLFTLRPADRGQEAEILRKLVNFGIKGSGTPIQQNALQSYALLGEAIEVSLKP